ncbi:MAG: hypothetical protein ACJAQ6_002011 [Arenicella sp.]|jgi:hypothetical protein
MEKKMKFQAVFYVVAAFLLTAPVHSAQANEPKGEKVYKLLGTAPKGRNMRPVEATSPIPFNKRYEQLDYRQMAIYRSYFEGLKETDTPPFPKKGIKEIYVPLIKGHKRIGGSGDLLVYAEINEKGGVDNVIVYESPTKKLADLATTVMFNTKFRPATCDGTPCTMDYPFYYDVPHRNRELKSLDKENFGKGDISTKPGG